MPQFLPSPSPGPNQRKIAQAERMEILGRLALFDGAAKRHLREIARQTRLEQFDPDQDLVVEGQPSTSAFVIVGELGLLTDRPRNATVRALGPMECLALDRLGLYAAATEHPALGWHLLTTVAERLSD